MAILEGKSSGAGPFVWDTADTKTYRGVRAVRTGKEAECLMPFTVVRYTL